MTLFGYAPQVLPAVDPDFGEVLERQLETKGVSAGTSTRATRSAPCAIGIEVMTEPRAGDAGRASADLVLVVTGVTLDGALALRHRSRAMMGQRDRRQRDHGDRCTRRARSRRPRPHIPPATRVGVPSAWHHGPQARRDCRRACARRASPIRGESPNAGDQGLRPRRCSHRPGRREGSSGGCHPYTHHTTADDHTRYCPGASGVHARIPGIAARGGCSAYSCSAPSHPAPISGSTRGQRRSSHAWPWTRSSISTPPTPTARNPVGPPTGRRLNAVGPCAKTRYCRWHFERGTYELR